MERKLSAILVIALMTIVGLSNMALQSPTALRLEQGPTDTPTATPVPPATDTPIPPATSTPIPPATSTPIPPATSTPVVNTPPPGSTSTPIVATKTPKPGGGGGGGGAPAGSSAPPTLNGCVRSVGKDGVGLSTEPGFYQPFIQDIPRNEILYVVDGPQRVDAIWWWKLRSAQGVEGWGNQDNITPDPGPCALVAPIAIGIATVPAVAATPASHLPQTGGGGNAVWFFAGLLLVVLIVSGVLRRRFQTETHSDSHLPD